MRKVTMVAAGAAVAGFFAAVGCDSVAAAQSGARGTVGHEDFRWSGRMARGNQLEVRGMVGNIEAGPASGSEVEVVGSRRGDGSEDIRVEVVEDGDDVIICAIYPGARPRRDADNACEVDYRDHDIDRGSARIDFTVRLPAGVRLSAGTLSGDVTAEGLRSRVDAATVNGDVRVSTTESASAASVSGNVTATFGASGSGDMEFATVSGDITLRLASNSNADIEVQTLSGDIDSDFDLRMGSMTGSDDDDEQPRVGGINIDVRVGRRARGSIGRGGPELSVNTVSGDIRLERVR